MAAKSTAKKSSPAPTRMPIKDYDRLPIKEILPRLTTLSGPELKVVAAHEKAGKNRVTLLRAVRKVELAREAAPASAPASHLTIVDDGPELVAVPVPEPVDDLPTLEVTRVTVAPEVAKAKVAPEVAKAAEAKEEKEPKAPHAPKKPRPRSAAKHATWEEELRPELPRRIESMAYDLDPPIIALVPDAPVMDDSTPTAISTPTLTGPAKVRRRFEGAALVMAAVLAVLLGLAIGTVLARSGSSTAQSSTPTAVTQSAAVQDGG
jgi:hypothetical protein